MLFQRLLAFTGDAVYRYRFEDGTILMANEGLVRVLGLDCRPEDLIGKHLKDVLIYTEREGTIRHAIETAGEIHGVEYHFRTLKGDDRWVIHDSFLSSDPATGERIVEAIAKDVTKRKLAELALRKANEELEKRVQQRTMDLEAVNRELEAFAYCISHDLRAPLRHIDGFSKALQEEYGERLDEGARDYLRRIRNGVQRLDHLMDEMLKVSRLSRGEMRHEWVDLSALAAEVARDLGEGEPARKVEWVIEPGLTDEGDTQLLRTALENLLGNAWKFTSTRSEAKIQFGSMIENGGKVYFVRDNGVGFNMAYADKLFAPFQRLHGNAEFPGTGIGLVSVHRIVARHGGRVWGRGEVDRGATFYFTLGRKPVPGVSP